ncbi:MAG TPA: hypothetical protein VE999_02675 [Gemmataceae bacterium]|nr:hypothetical protein [Gemmataceae bacterium]
MRRASVPGSWLMVGCTLLAAGCQGGPSTERFVPAPERARQALEQALRSWQQGKPPGKLEALANPEVILVDTCRRPEQTLDQFTILGEAPGEGPRCFAVKLRLQNPEGTQRVRFVVFGDDPLWVYRYEDYERMIHWECGSDEPAEKGVPVAR